MPSLQQQQRFGSQLRDAGLGHAELVRDLLHRALLVEVRHDDVPQPLGQRLDRVDQVRLALAVEDRVLGAGIAGREERLGVAFDDERVVVEDGRAVDVVEQLVHGVGLDAELACGLVGRRRPAEPVRQLVVRGLQPPGPRPDRAARPVAAAQLVEQRTADAGRGEAVECDAPLRVEGPGRLGEAQHAGRDQVVAADVVRDPMHDLRNHVLHECQVLPDQSVLVCSTLDVDLGVQDAPRPQ